MPSQGDSFTEARMLAIVSNWPVVGKIFEIVGNTFHFLGNHGVISPVGPLRSTNRNHLPDRTLQANAPALAGSGR